MHTPFLDGIRKAAANSGLNWAPGDEAKQQKIPGLPSVGFTKSDIGGDLPATISKAIKARESAAGTPKAKGPRATGMTAQNDNIADYQLNREQRQQ